MAPEFTVLDVGGAEAWEEWTLENVAVTDGRVELERESHPTYAVSERVGADSLSDVSSVDVDTDRCGAVHVLSADGSLHRSEPSGDRFERLPCNTLSNGAFRPTAFCLSGDTIFVAETPLSADSDGADAGRGRLRALSAHLRQTRWIVEQVTDGVAFRRPTSVVAGPSTREVFVLDRGEDDDGFVAGVRDDGTTRLVRSGLDSAVDITVDAQGDLYVLSAGGGRGRLTRYPGVAPETSRFSEDSRNEGGKNDGTRTVVRRLPHAFDDVACLESVGNGAFVLGLDPAASGEKTLLRYDYEDRSFDRLTGYRGNCVRLRRADAAGTAPSLYAIRNPAADETDATAPRLYRLDGVETIRRANAEVRAEVRTAEADSNAEYVGRLTERFYVGGTRTQWYRLALNVTAVPPGTQVTLWHATTTTADEKPAWTRAPTPNPTALLVPSARDRYLWIRLSLVGTQYDSPAVEGLRLAYGHDSYVRYLPAIYAESDGEVIAESDGNPMHTPNGAFLQRFLAVFESTFGEIDVELDGLTRHFDPRSAPATGLSWLGGWLGVARDDSWSDRSKRLLIEEAPTLFKQRGTRRGLRRMLDIYLMGVAAASPTRVADTGSVEPNGDGDEGRDGRGEGDGGGQARRRPSERHHVGSEGRDGPGASDSADGECDDGSDTAVHDHFVALFEFDDVRDCIDENGDADAVAQFKALVSCPQEFAVLVGPTLDRDARATVERIVDTERPAHATGRVVFLPPSPRLGQHAHLGVNTRLPSRDFVVGETELGSNAVLIEREPGAQLGRKARLGEDVELS